LREHLALGLVDGLDGAGVAIPGNLHLVEAHRSAVSAAGVLSNTTRPARNATA
jgi:hypothetical protein